MITDALERFSSARPRLLRLAYSQLGDLGEAEDVVQEAWLRLERADRAAIEDLGAWLTTVVSRIALDALGSADMRPVDVNGMPGLLILDREDRQVSVVAFTVDDGRITTIHIQRNPDKLRHVASWPA